MHQRQQELSLPFFRKITAAYVSAIREKYKKMREDHSSRQTEKNLLSLSDARKNRLFTDWKNFKIFEPLKPGLHHLNEIDLNDTDRLYRLDLLFLFLEIIRKISCNLQ